MCTIDLDSRKRKVWGLMSVGVKTENRSLLKPQWASSSGTKQNMKCDTGSTLWVIHPCCCYFNYSFQWKSSDYLTCSSNKRRISQARVKTKSTFLVAASTKISLILNITPNIKLFSQLFIKTFPCFTHSWLKSLSVALASGSILRNRLPEGLFLDSCQQVWREEYLIRSHLIIVGQLVGLGENAWSSVTAQCSPPTAWTDEENRGGGKVGVSK